MRDASVLICTHNRDASLAATLEAFRRITWPGAGALELLVVDNNSSDRTHEVVHAASRTLPVPVRYAFEPRQGLSCARNRALAEARGEILAFTDDDVVPDEAWLVELLRAFDVHRADGVGGRVLPRFAIEPPAWLYGLKLERMLAINDWGDEPLCPATFNPNLIYGANFALRRDAVLACGNFDERLGRAGGNLAGGEEVEFFERLHRRGKRLVYEPKALVHHCIPAERLRAGYFRKWKYDQGRMWVRSNPGGGSCRRPWHLRHALRLAWAMLALRARRDGAGAMRKELELSFTVGRIVEAWRPGRAAAPRAVAPADAVGSRADAAGG